MHQHKKENILFAIFGLIMAAVHFTQCVFRIKSHTLFVELGSSVDTAVKNATLKQLSNDAKCALAAYLILGILFFIYIGYLLIYRKIGFGSVLLRTAAVYLASLLVSVPFLLTASQTQELWMPIVISLIFTCVQIAGSGIKRYTFQKAQKKFPDFPDSKSEGPVK
nr:hypothetical protein [uncultured Caproiciproducens sp.]